MSDETPIVNDRGYLYSIWIYQETNGEPGLQRGDEACHEYEGEGDLACIC